MAEHIPQDWIKLLLAKIDIVDLIHTYIPLNKKSGHNYFACCPFHNEKSASFSVSQPKQFYYCFGCGAHGNAIDFMMQHERLNFPEAIESLAQRAGMAIPRRIAPLQRDDSLSALYKVMVAVTAHYTHQMFTSKRAIRYLKTRGISKAVAQQFNLGYAPGGWTHLLHALGKTEADKKKLLEAGVVIQRENGAYYDRFRDRILFPIHDYRGRVIGFGGRILDRGEPKYLNSPETALFQKSHELYGLYQAIQANHPLRRVVIVEGYTDVITLFQHGVTDAVATLGTATTSQHLQRLVRYTTEMIFCFDGDEAGRTAAWRALEVALPLMHDHLQIRFLFLPEGEDPDTLIRKEGKQQFEGRLAAALSLSAFFFQGLSQQYDTSTMEGRAHLATQALTYLKQLPTGLFQRLLLDELAKRTRIDIVALEQKIGTLKKKEEKKSSDKLSLPKVKLPAPVRRAIALLLQHPHLALLALPPLPQVDLEGYGFFLDLLRVIRENPTITTGALKEYWRNQDEAQWIVQLASGEHIVPEQGVESEFLGVIRQFILHHYDAEINRLLAQAAQEELKEPEKQELANWISKKKELANTPA